MKPIIFVSSTRRTMILSSNINTSSPSSSVHSPPTQSHLPAHWKSPFPVGNSYMFQGTSECFPNSKSIVRGCKPPNWRPPVLLKHKWIFPQVQNRLSETVGPASSEAELSASPDPASVVRDNGPQTIGPQGSHQRSNPVVKVPFRQVLPFLMLC